MRENGKPPREKGYSGSIQKKRLFNSILVSFRSPSTAFLFLGRLCSRSEGPLGRLPGRQGRRASVDRLPGLAAEGPLLPHRRLRVPHDWICGHQCNHIFYSLVILRTLIFVSTSKETWSRAYFAANNCKKLPPVWKTHTFFWPNFWLGSERFKSKVWVWLPCAKLSLAALVHQPHSLYMCV